MQQTMGLHVLDKSYIVLPERMIRGKHLLVFIKRQEKEVAQEVTEFLWCKFAGVKEYGDEEVDLEMAAKQAQEKFGIQITVEECYEKKSETSKPTFKIYVGEKEVDPPKDNTLKIENPKKDNKKKRKRKKDQSNKRKSR